jgi:hypothetical protein
VVGEGRWWGEVGGVECRGWLASSTRNEPPSLTSRTSPVSSATRSAFKLRVFCSCSTSIDVIGASR